MRLNKNIGWFQYLPVPCSQKYEIQGVLTHEFGHVFGMEHVYETTHPEQTMSTQATPCSYADSTLGWGDYTNMTLRYGS